MAEQSRAETFAAILAGVHGGLSLRQAAAVQGISHARIATWVALGDSETPPYDGFLASLVKQDAEIRAQVLADLREMATVDNSARRDLCRQIGSPTPLERELDQLRRMPNTGAAMIAEMQQNLPPGFAGAATRFESMIRGVNRRHAPGSDVFAPGWLERDDDFEAPSSEQADAADDNAKETP
jgi:hypothetical protein